MYAVMLLNRVMGWLLVSIFGSFMGSSGNSFMISFLGFSTFLFSVLAFMDVGLSGNLMVSNYWSWILLGDLNVEMGLLFDSMTVVMLMVVTGISFLVYCYSMDYMSSDRHMSSFLSYLSLFSFFMVVLVTAPSYLQMFMGWEGVGIASFLLMNFWSTSLSANKAAFKAVMFNSLGDYCLSLSVCLIQLVFGSVSYSLVNATVQHLVVIQYNVVVLLGILLFMAACGKSAQLGLHFWLRDAMEGPTRVSALMHAATMVTAGMFVLLSSSRLLEFTRQVLVIMAIIGGLTAVFAALMGVVQSDIKKVMAFSTCSQLGYMTLSCGLSLYDVGLFHLVTHATFKALLFLSAGSIIHSASNEQSLMSYGGFISWLPWTYINILVASLALGGMPFLAGFYSKDTMLELMSTNMQPWVSTLWFLDSLAAGLTVVYSVSVIVLVFLVSRSLGHFYFLKGLLDGGNLMSIVFIPLVLCSILLGYFGESMFMSEGSMFWGNALFMEPYKFLRYMDHHLMCQEVKLFPSMFAMFAMCMSLLFLFFSFKGYNLYFHLRIALFSGLSSSFYLDALISLVITNMSIFSYSVTYQLMDKGLLDQMGPSGFPIMMNNLSSYFSGFSNGYIFGYMFWILMFILLGVLIAGL